MQKDIQRTNKEVEVNKEVTKLVRRLKHSGYEVVRSSSGRLKVKSSAWQTLYVLHETPSDSRSLKNAIAGLRRVGVDI